MLLYPRRRLYLGQTGVALYGKAVMDRKDLIWGAGVLSIWDCMKS
jgi:hypothetical protein